MSACVEPDVLVAFASGRLARESLEAVESHLDSCASCRAAMAAAARADSNDTTAPSGTGTLTPLRNGTRVGRYEVQSVAGAGGMGVIYRALDPTLNRTVALKLVRPDRLNGPENAERLLFEAKAMARVVHPEVLPVFDAGHFGDEVFIAMEWVEGRTLRAELSARVHGWRETVQLFVRAGRGLAAAHRAGLVHRDFKPENVLVGTDGRLRVSDFGLAHETAQTASPGGTVAFMAPELLRGEAATAASDQYAFCVALREALREPRPRAIDALVQRGLEAAPAARHPSMDTLADALERAARPAPARAWVAASPLVALAAVAAWASWVRVDEARCSGGDPKLAAIWNAPRRAALLAAAGRADAARAARVAGVLDAFSTRWASAHRAACEATRVTNEQSELLMDLKIACLDQRLAAVNALLRELERAPQTAFAKSVEAAQDAVTIGRCAEAAYLNGGGATQLSAEQRARVASLREALAALRPLTVMGPFEQGRTRAEALLAEAQRLGVKSVESDAHLRVAEFLRKLRSTKEATPALDAHLDEAILAGTEAQYPHGVGEAWLLRMRACTDDGRFDEADKAERGLTANLRALGGDAWLQARHDLSHGMLLMRESKLDDSLASLAHADEQLAKLPEEERRLVAANVHSGEALVRMLAGDVEGASKRLEQTIAETEESFGPDHVSLGDMHHNLAEAQLTLGKLAAAQQHVDQAAKIWGAVFGPENPRIAVNLALRVGVLKAQQRFDEARADVDEAKRVLTKNHLETSYMFMRVLCAEGSEASLRAGLALAPAAAGKYPLDEATCHRALAEVLAASKPDEARAEYERAIALYGDAKATGVWVERAKAGLAKLGR